MSNDISSNERVNISLDPPVREVVIRHGEAEKIYDPERITVRGDITAVSQFLLGRKQFITDDSYMAVNWDAGIIAYFENPINKFGAVSTAYLLDAPELERWREAITERMTLEKFTQVVRQFRYYFADKQEHTKLLVALSEFSISVSTNIENSNDRRGNMNKQLLQEVHSSIPANFTLSIPLFKNMPPTTFVLDLLFEVYDNSVRFTVESVELYELQQSERVRIIQEELQKLEQFNITTIYN